MNGSIGSKNLTRSYFRTRRTPSPIDATIFIPHTNPFRDPLRSLQLSAHSDEVTSIKFSHDGSLFASSSKDKTIVVWETHTLCEKIRLVGHIGAVTDISFHPDNSTLASSSIDHTMVVWCLETGRHKMKVHR